VTRDSPPLYPQDALQVVSDLEAKLSSSGVQCREGSAGWGLVRLFGRVAEILINRLNQVPEKHFRAFLNAAGVDLLAPRAALMDLTFTHSGKTDAVVRVPEGTQAVSVQTESKREVVFETVRNLNVVPVRIAGCLSIDPRATRTTPSRSRMPWLVLRRLRGVLRVHGQRERERAFYIADDELLEFADAASRENATITLSIRLEAAGDHLKDGWDLELIHWDGTAWQNLPSTGVRDCTDKLSHDGTVTLTHLPEIAKVDVAGTERIWLGCRLTGGGARRHLPMIRRISGSRSISIKESTAKSMQPSAPFRETHRT